MSTNLITNQVESRLGAFYVSVFALFMIGLIFIALKNFNSDNIILDSGEVRVKNISNAERILIAEWAKQNNVKIPESKGIRYIIQQYPDRPWDR